MKHLHILPINQPSFLNNLLLYSLNYNKTFFIIIQNTILCVIWYRFVLISICKIGVIVIDVIVVFYVNCAMGFELRERLFWLGLSLWLALFLHLDIEWYFAIYYIMFLMFSIAYYIPIVNDSHKSINYSILSKNSIVFYQIEYMDVLD